MCNKKLKVIFIDDEPMFLKLYQRFISGNDNVSAKLFKDPVQALKFLAKEHFDLVVTDFDMPRMNGVALITAGKEVQPTETVFVLCTGNSFREEYNIADCYVNKPRIRVVSGIIDCLLKGDKSFFCKKYS